MYFRHVYFKHTEGPSSKEGITKEAAQPLGTATLPGAFPMGRATAGLEGRRKNPAWDSSIGALLFSGLAFLKHVAYTKAHSGCFHMFCMTNISVRLELLLHYSHL